MRLRIFVTIVYLFSHSQEVSRHRFFKSTMGSSFSSTGKSKELSNNKHNQILKGKKTVHKLIAKELKNSMTFR